VPAPCAAARARIRLYARPELRGEELGIDSDRFAATYFRIVMGFDAKQAGLLWVRTFEHDVVGGAAARGGFALCDAAGSVWLLDAAGRSSGKAELGKPIDGCVVEPGKLEPKNGKPLGSLPEQIGAAIRVRETELAVAQRFLLRELGAIEDPVVTKALIEVTSDPRTSPFLLADARQLLAARRTGADHMLEALARQYDFLSDVLRPPPVGPLADALAAMNEERAAPLLASHLNDPANTPDDIERAARALAKLATTDEAEELRTFFALYRATADQRELVNAVLSVAEALLRVGGEDGARAVRRAAEDPLTHPEVKKGIAQLISTPGKPPAG
jgi:outer membrane protein assembly factor BamB